MFLCYRIEQNEMRRRMTKSATGLLPSSLIMPQSDKLLRVTLAPGTEIAPPNVDVENVKEQLRVATVSLALENVPQHFCAAY